MLSSDAFSYVNVLDKAADASWMRSSAIANNIANVDTPGYKRQDVEFAQVLKQNLMKAKYNTLDKAIDGVDLSQLRPKVYTDMKNFSYRLDGNNVDIDTENVELASEQLRYNTLTSSMKHEFQMFTNAIKTS